MRDRKNMATARKAYTSEFYAYNYAPERQPERVRRTRQRPEVNTESREKKNKREQAYTAAVLRSLIVAVVAVGILFIGIVVVNAQAAKLQYSINQLRSENSTIQTEIDMLTIKLDGSKTINNWSRMLQRNWGCTILRAANVYICQPLSLQTEAWRIL